MPPLDDSDPSRSAATTDNGATSRDQIGATIKARLYLPWDDLEPGPPVCRMRCGTRSEGAVEAKANGQGVAHANDR